LQAKDRLAYVANNTPTKQKALWHNSKALFVFG